MMRYLVVSDSHLNRDCLVELVAKYRGEVNQMFHCGDSQLSSDDKLWDDLIVVRGNCDFGGSFSKEQFYDNQVDRIFMTHGHLFNVNFTLNELAYRGKELGASMVFYGHTHVLSADMIEGMLLVNPGSIVEPCGKYNKKTYAIIESDTKEIRIQYFDANHHQLADLSQVFTK